MDFVSFQLVCASMRLFIVIVNSVNSVDSHKVAPYIGYFVIAYVAAVTYLAVRNKKQC